MVKYPNDSLLIEKLRKLFSVEKVKTQIVLEYIKEDPIIIISE
ncbi:MAG: hypothetical protein ACP6IY_18755 [Promethearchaeia archaeon]